MPTARLPRFAREFELGREARTGEWFDHVQAITAALAAAGHAIGGFDLVIDSDVPEDSGLAARVALAVALLRGLRELFSLRFDDHELAALVHGAQREFLRAPFGLVDPLACSLGAVESALCIDTRSLAIERIPLPPNLGLVVLDSGVPHELASAFYPLRRAECDEAAARLRVAKLRDVAVDDPRIDELPGVLPRRVRHVVQENLRVGVAARALAAGDLEALGGLLDDSHRSLRDDFEVSIPEIERLVELAREHERVFGARLTGGGFGGAVVIVTDDRGADSVAVDVAAAYAAEIGRRPIIILPGPRGAAEQPADDES